MKTYICDNAFYIEGGETKQGNPVIITLGYIKDCVKSLKTLWFKDVEIFAKFSILDDFEDAWLFDQYKRTMYNEFIKVTLSRYSIQHEYKSEMLSFKPNIDRSYDYEGNYKYFYLNRITEVKIKFN